MSRQGGTRALWVAGALGVVVLAGCGRPASVGPPAPILTDADRSLIGSWTDTQTGQPLPDGTRASDGKLVVGTSGGSTTCSASQGTVFLQLAWPLGTTADLWSSGLEEREAPQFVRDTRESAMETEGSSDFDVDLPANVRPTGFERNGNTISVDPRARSIYLTRPDGTSERWARMKPGQGCA